MGGERELDVVVFGAIGFAGRLVAGYLAGHAPGGVGIGLAGRSARRLADLRARLGAAASAWPLLVADSADQASVTALARAARVVAATVGPAAVTGLGWSRRAPARAPTTPTCPVKCCSSGKASTATTRSPRRRARALCTAAEWDSIPSDLGVLPLHEAARADGAGDLEGTTLVVTALRGGISAGTLASGQGQLEEMRASAAARTVVADPYALRPDRAAEPHLGDERDLGWITRDDDLGAGSARS